VGCNTKLDGEIVEVTSLRPKMIIIVGVRVTSLTEFGAIFVSSNNFVKKLDSNIYIMILIVYHKY
jgi:hypothetical protein